MRFKRRRRAAFIPLYSMSDVAFLLLIFIMLVSLINYRVEVDIQHAQAQTASRVSAGRNLEIWVDRLGGLYLEGRPSSLAAIEHSVADTYRRAADTRVHIIADRYTPFENVHEVLGVLQRLQYPRVSFVVRNE
ncbi:MAG: biopolymer transporter ExbD [Treponema sp.]|nr:biopolymer transporter ExbD [Treponema sp.]